MDIYRSDDYAGIKIGNKEYYYGYEHTWCKKHQKIDCKDETCDEQSKKEWIFIVLYKGEIIQFYPTGYLKRKFKNIDDNDMYSFLAAGIALYKRKRGRYQMNNNLKQVIVNLLKKIENIEMRLSNIEEGLEMDIEMDIENHKYQMDKE